jgi:hypothetical protein
MTVMRVAPLIHEHSLNDITNLEIEMDLHREDKSSLHNIDLAREASELLRGKLTEFITAWAKDDGGNNKTKQDEKKQLTLAIKITRCTEGSRMGRICCAELGMGWALFHFSWQLKHHKIKIIGVEKEAFGDAGAIGFADLCDSQVGDLAVKDAAVFKGPMAIKKKIEMAFQSKS